ncbi:hypothetical protein [Thermosipho sp. 1074]|uniref:hypothetical protein n=1 Tax=Thermosipho sp. 1074 TaxID=1643331 RepID=UPI0009851AC5|nr:hypothetical protein [Thermosipho sp. 1074]OOC42188.1 hypothetical protein XO08_07855 [Thermosipho sp. 1074]
MTNLEYLRMKIPDKDMELFTDVELQEIIKLNSEIKVLQGRQIDVDGKVFKIDAYRLDETYAERVFIGLPAPENELTTGFTIDKDTAIIYFDSQMQVDVFVQAKVINWNDVLADCYEMIMGDYRKLNSYSIQNASQQIDDTKRHLRYLVNYYRNPRGWEL